MLLKGLVGDCKKASDEGSLDCGRLQSSSRYQHRADNKLREPVRCSENFEDYAADLAAIATSGSTEESTPRDNLLDILCGLDFMLKLSQDQGSTLNCDLATGKYRGCRRSLPSDC